MNRDDRLLMAVRLARYLPRDGVAIIGASSELHVLACLTAMLTGGRMRFVMGGSGLLVSTPGDWERVANGSVRSLPIERLIDFGDWRSGFFDVGILGGLQIDRFGNTNTIGLGDHARPSLRGPGVIGQGALAALAKKTILVTERHSPGVLVEAVDHVSGFGHYHRGRQRGAGPSQGPEVLITPLAEFTFEGAPRSATLAKIVSGSSLDAVQASTQFKLTASSEMELVEEPAPKESDAVSEAARILGV